MEQIWEVIKSVKTQSDIKINTEICNTGEVRLKAYFKEKEIAKYDLSLGKGLYINYIHDVPSVFIVQCGGDIYRHVYFMQYTGHQYKKCWQIHHLDYNHCNNSIDNLVYCTAKDHGLYHAFQFKLANEAQGYEQDWSDIELKQLEDYNKAKEYYKWLKDNKDKFNIKVSTEYYRQIRKEIEQIAKPLIEQDRIERAKQREQQREQQKIKKQNKKEQDRIDKLNSGNYIEKDGKIICIHFPQWTEERRLKTMKTRYEKVYNNPEWRNKCRTGLLKTLREHPELTRKGQPCKYKGSIGISKDGVRMYIFEDELQHYIDLGWHKGFK